MTRLRSSLLLLAVAALLLAGVPVSADTQNAIAAPAAAPWLDAGQCASPATPVASAGLAVSESDFILCSCRYCRTHPEDICQISPTGYSTLCSDYYANNC
jgi:hypothetical protein